MNPFLKFSESKIFFVRCFRLLPFALPAQLLFVLMMAGGCLLTSDSFSQSGTWVSVYGGTNYDQGRGIAQTSDKGYIVCGTTSSYGMGNTDVYLLKIDSAGKFQWQNTFGGINIENCFSVKQTNDAGFIICGYTNSFGAGGYDAYLVKTDSTGNLEWQKTYGGGSWDFTYWTEQTSDGGYILAGETYSYGNNNRAYLIKTDSNGDTLWTKMYGGTISNYTREVHQTPDSGYIFAGSVQTGTGNKDFFLVKTNPLGDTLWTKTYGRSNNDSCTTVAICMDKGFLLGGGSDINGTDKDYFLKTDSVGNFLYAVVDTPSGIATIVISRIRETFFGEFVMLVNTYDSGSADKLIALFDWHPGGVWPWGYGFGGPKVEEGYDFVQTSDSGFALVGYTSSLGKGPDNIYIAKTDRLGHYDHTVNTYVSANEISETNENTLIFPNPFSAELFIKIDPKFFSEGKDFLFEITDVCGKKIISTGTEIAAHSPKPQRIEIPAEKFSKGIYIASLQSGNKKIYRKLLFMK
jgi:hypothetical protein